MQPDFIVWIIPIFTDSLNIIENIALAGVPQLIENWPADRKFAGSIPSQSTCLGCGPGPQLRPERSNQSLFLSHIMSLSLSFSFLSPLFKNK